MGEAPSRSILWGGGGLQKPLPLRTWGWGRGGGGTNNLGSKSTHTWCNDSCKNQTALSQHRREAFGVRKLSVHCHRSGASLADEGAQPERVWSFILVRGASGSFAWGQIPGGNLLTVLWLGATRSTPSSSSSSPTKHESREGLGKGHPPSLPRPALLPSHPLTCDRALEPQ